MNKIKSSERGQILVLLVLALVGLLGFTALAIDGGMIYADRRYMQSSADAASLAGAGKIASEVEKIGMQVVDWSCSTLSSAVIPAGGVTAKTKATANGFSIDVAPSSGADGTVTITCSDAERAVDVKVDLTRTTSTSFIQVITGEPMKNSVTSTTTVNPGTKAGGGYAIVALREAPCASSDVGVTISGTSDVLLVDGGVWSNSCMKINGTPTVKVKKGSPTGEILAHSIKYHQGETLDVVPATLPIEPYPEPTAALHPATNGLDVDIRCTDKSSDPYENIGQHSDSSPMDLAAGNYGDLKLTKGTITLLGGLYCIDGTVDMSGGTFTVATKDGLMQGVTLYFTGKSFTINGGVHVVLAAANELPNLVVKNPGSAIEDLLIYVPKANNPVIKLNGNAGSSISGTIFAPGSFIDIGGTTNLATGEKFSLAGSIIGLDVKVAGVPGLNIRYDESQDYGTPTSLYVRK